MSQDFDAIFTEGHLVPLEPVDLREKEKVRVHVEQFPQDATGSSTHDLTGMTLS